MELIELKEKIKHWKCIECSADLEFWEQPLHLTIIEEDGQACMRDWLVAKCCDNYYSPIIDKQNGNGEITFGVNVV